MNGWWGLVALAVWAVGCGLIIGNIMQRHENKCVKCQANLLCSDDGTGAAVACGVLWPLLPLVLPFIAGGLIGVYAANRPTRQKSKADRKKLEHERRMAEAHAQKAAADAALAVLEAEGWNARVTDPDE